MEPRASSIVWNFYPRPPRGGRRKLKSGAGWISLFLSTPSARRATGAGVHLALLGVISIHALREEGDWDQPDSCCREPYFYPRPPRGGRLEMAQDVTAIKKFLSTPSARRATVDVLQP